MKVIPMPMHYGGHGHISPEQAIGLLIACNIIIFLVFIAFALRWVYLKYKVKDEYLDGFFSYTIWDDIGGAEINTICFIVVNGIAVLLALTSFISKLL